MVKNKLGLSWVRLRLKVEFVYEITIDEEINTKLSSYEGMNRLTGLSDNIYTNK